MTSSHGLPSAWKAHALTSLAEHIAEAVHAHLPVGDEVIVTGNHLVLTRRGGSGSPRTVVTHEMSPVHDTDQWDRTAAQLLDDLQDMVIGSLHRPWPDCGGGGLHPRTRLDGDSVALAFASHDGSDVITLPPFPVPPEPERVATAG